METLLGLVVIISAISLRGIFANALPADWRDYVLAPSVFLAANPFPEDWRDYVPSGAPKYSQPMRDGLFEGDIVMPNKVNSAEADVDVLADVARSAVKGDTMKWPNRTVFYSISSYFTNGERDVIRGAMRNIAAHSCIRFVERTYQLDYIFFSGNSTGCWSYVGRQGGRQELNLDRVGCIRQGLAVHELLHALGFHHEQSRSDRDDHVIINWDNIHHSKHNQFLLRDTDNLNTPYDYGSIMHYAMQDFSMDSQKPAFIPKVKGITVGIGQRKGLSPMDIHRLNVLYDCKSLPVLPSTNRFRATKLTPVLPSAFLSRALVCLNGRQSCGTSCYVPGRLTCYDGLLCLAHEHRCGGKCYNRSMETCFNDRWLCPKEERLCSEICYDPIRRICSRGELLSCKLGQRLCSSNICYDPTVHSCLNDTLCSLSHLLCGSVCYDPMKQICLANSTLCPIGQTLCGGKCLNPTLRTCLSKSGKNYDCPVGDLLCLHNVTCYDPSVETCFEDKLLCRIGELPCGEQCYDPLAGERCIGNETRLHKIEPLQPLQSLQSLQPLQSEPLQQLKVNSETVVLDDLGGRAIKIEAELVKLTNEGGLSATGEWCDGWFGTCDPVCYGYLDTVTPEAVLPTVGSGAQNHWRKLYQTRNVKSPTFSNANMTSTVCGDQYRGVKFRVYCEDYDTLSSNEVINRWDCNLPRDPEEETSATWHSGTCTPMFQADKMILTFRYRIQSLAREPCGSSS